MLASVGDGKVKHFSPDGTLIQVLDAGTGATETTGGCFDDDGNFYVTSFQANEFSKFDADGDLVDGDFADGFDADPESCLQMGNGDFLVGQADGTGDVLRFAPTGGSPIATYDVPVPDRGSDWIDLAGDQCTLYYAGEGDEVFRYDICADAALPSFATGLTGGPCYALKIRLNGEVMVACTDVAHRLSPAGAVLQTYDPPGSSTLFALNLDPNGTSFWTGDIGTGEIWKINIATGAIEENFNTAPFSTLAGITIVGEILSSNEGPPGSPSCSDGVDNDNDGLVDQNDPDCVGDEGPPGDPTCTDGIDNDNDGLIDASDPDCIDVTPAKPCANPTITGNGVVNGTAGPDVIWTGAGNDTVNGNGGDDVICTDGGNDVVNGGGGNDRIYGQADNDTLNGQKGDDEIHGGKGDDTIGAQDGNDRLYGEQGIDVMRGDAGNDLVKGGAGNDAMRGNGGDDSMAGDDGDDELRGDDGMDFMQGGIGNDVMYGGAQDDVVNGDAGADRLWGLGGNDRLSGGTGNDALNQEDGAVDSRTNGGADTDVCRIDTPQDVPFTTQCETVL